MKIVFKSLYSYPSLTTEIIQTFYISYTNNEYIVEFNGLIYKFKKINGEYYSHIELTNIDFLHALKIFERKLKLEKLLK